MLIVSAIMFVFASCTDSEEIRINYQVDITISPETVISGFQEYKSGNLTLDEGYKIRIRNLIYDNNSDLVAINEGLVEQYSENYQFTQLLPDGKYTIITSTDVVYGNSISDIKSTYWSFTREKKLNEFMITRENILCFMGKGTLGLSQSILNVDGKSESFKVNVKPITALITCHFLNIHQEKVYNGSKLSPTYLEFQYKNAMDIINWENDSWKFSTSAAETETFRLDFIDLTDPYYDDSNNIYNLVSAIPSDTEFNGYVSYISSDGEKYSTKTNKVSVKIESGKQYDFSFDSYPMTLVIESKNKSIPDTYKFAFQKELLESSLSKTKSFKVIELLK